MISLTLTLNDALRWTGVSTGILGAVLLSFGVNHGWLFWIPSNLALIALFLRSKDMEGLPLLYIVYLITTLNGIRTSFFVVA